SDARGLPDLRMLDRSEPLGRRNRVSIVARAEAEVAATERERNHDDDRAGEGRAQHEMPRCKNGSRAIANGKHVASAAVELGEFTSRSSSRAWWSIRARTACPR